MGKTLQTRTCALVGTVDFKPVNGSIVAQLDQNSRDPYLGTPLCFPISTMIFHAGVVASKVGRSIKHLVAVQIEPQGRIRVITHPYAIFPKGPVATATQMKRGQGSERYTKLLREREPQKSQGGPLDNPDKLFLRLDGITYHPLMRNLRSPTQCVPYCFDESEDVRAKEVLSGTACVKYCTPSEIDPKTKVNIKCKCDMVKRLECWARGNMTTIRCGQFKQLMGMHHTMGKQGKSLDEECSEVCAKQLASL
jgi:hypothetical protein